MADRSALAALRPQRRAELDEVRTLLLLFFCCLHSFVCSSILLFASSLCRHEVRRSVADEYMPRIARAKADAAKAAKALTVALASAAASAPAAAGAQATAERSAATLKTAPGGAAPRGAAPPGSPVKPSPRVSDRKKGSNFVDADDAAALARRTRRASQPHPSAREQNHSQFVSSLKAALSAAEWAKWEDIMKVRSFVCAGRSVARLSSSCGLVLSQRRREVATVKLSRAHARARTLTHSHARPDPRYSTPPRRLRARCTERRTWSRRSFRRFARCSGRSTASCCCTAPASSPPPRRAA